MENFLNAEFKRKFAVSFYKNLKLGLSEMSFCKDFVTNRRGDPYPLLESGENAGEDLDEAVADNTYVLRRGSAKRWLCQFFPYATYEVTAEWDGGAVGFCFAIPEASASVTVSLGMLQYRCGDRVEERKLPSFAREANTLAVSCRPGAFDVYVRVQGKAEYLCTFEEERFGVSHRYTSFTNGYAALLVSGNVTVRAVTSYIDNGVSVADMRPIRYENGEIMIEGGRVYITASVRMQAGTFQGVFSWIPGTAEFALTGALFYDSGDGLWCGDVAASVLYHRGEKAWYLWVCSFAHDHILGHAAFAGDPRFGVNVVDIELMEKAPDGAELSAFLGFSGDEDPDFFYDEEKGRWLMAICRVDPTMRAYRYVFFASERPFDGYRYIGQGTDGCETGGSFVTVGGKIFFVCGNDFSKTSDYRIYHKGGMSGAKFDYPDGGFRGWGTVMPIRQGSRTRYFWLTFDRHGGSDYTWSYGNLYCFEAP